MRTAFRMNGHDYIQSLSPVRLRGAFHTYSGPSRFVVVAAPHADQVAANAKLDLLARAHALVDSPFFPKVTARSMDPPFVEFAFEGVADGESVLERLGASGRQLTYPQAIAFIRSLGEAMVALHATRDPESGAPLAMGSLCWANFIHRRDGRVAYIGLGHNIIASNEHGLASGVSAFVAPEVASGAAPSPAHDLCASMAMNRAMLPFVDLPPRLQRAFRATESGPARRLIRWANHAVLAAPARARPSARVALLAFERMWKLLGVEPDEAAYRHLIMALIAPPDRPVVEVARDGSWLRSATGDHSSLERRRAPRRILCALLDARGRGKSLDVETLLAAGWPGERTQGSTGQNRVHVALHLLRRIGLQSVIQRFDGGYRLDPRTPIRVSAA